MEAGGEDLVNDGVGWDWLMGFDVTSPRLAIRRAPYLLHDLRFPVISVLYQKIRAHFLNCRQLCLVVWQLPRRSLRLT